MAESKGFFRCTPVHLRVASLLDHVGKNSLPDCFLPQTSLLPPCSNPSFCFAKAKSRPCDLLFVLANNSNFDRKRVRGCNYGLEGGAFSVLGGAVLDLRGCITLPVRTAINRRR